MTTDAAFIIAVGVTLAAIVALTCALRPNQEERQQHTFSLRDGDRGTER